MNRHLDLCLSLIHICSLDNCRKGFLKGLESEGIKEGENLKITYKNSQADTATDNQIASNFASKKLDMICAIATPSAQSAYNATKDSDIPVVYTAVTSPKAAGFVDKEGKNVGNITGTSDLVLADKQLKLIRQMMPKAKNVGIFYSTNEANSKAGIEAYEKVADKYGFKIITQGITASADMPMAADSLLKKVCLLYTSIKTKSYEEMSKKAANIIASVVTLKPDCMLGLATGSSPIGTYDELVKKYEAGDLDFSEVTTVNLDEYKGLPKENEQSYYYFMHEYLFDKVNINPEKTYLPDGTNLNSEEEAARYEALVQSLGTVDLQLLGLGRNGHIGFNEPGDHFEDGRCV